MPDSYSGDTSYQGGAPPAGGMSSQDDIEAYLAKIPTAMGLRDKMRAQIMGAQEKAKTYGDVDAFQKAAQAAAGRIRGYAGQLEAGGYDPATMERYYQEAEKPLQGQFYDTSHAVAADYARRGLGSSDSASAAQGGAARDFGAASAMARLKAQDTATQERRQNILAALGATGAEVGVDQAGLQPRMQLWDIYNQNYRQKMAADAAENASMWGGLGSLLGVGGGIAAGALRRGGGGGGGGAPGAYDYSSYYRGGVVRPSPSMRAAVALKMGRAA